MESRLTVIVTTSATRSNPLTDVIEAVFTSFAVVPGLAACRKLLVFDGYTSVEGEAKFKSGRLPSEEIERYAKYIDAVRSLIERHPAFVNTTPVVLDERHGFGYAVRAALEMTTTPYVMVVQHDYQFVGASLPGEAILDLMDARPEINYVGFKGAANTTHVLSHKALVNVLRKRGVPLTMVPPDLPVPLAKLLFWYDKNHIARASAYRSLVFEDGSTIVRRGDFIEDRLGHKILAEIREGGDAAHATYGTYLYHPDDESVALRHLDGRKYLRPDQIVARYPRAIPRAILPFDGQQRDARSPNAVVSDALCEQSSAEAVSVTVG
eukprot:TRINITY_DN7884_c0_g1_i1.p1 TRINITY_DN7884_c0_g1~~TRINITY_DN7884_c0_g1_i1.p1  ORF type:complete len:323 (+),score=102.03 TRINITY_DN7884_c0_g1_i1:671-1639(+)